MAEDSSATSPIGVYSVPTLGIHLGRLEKGRGSATTRGAVSMTTQTAAAEALAHFTQDTRKDGERFYLLTDDAP